MSVAEIHHKYSPSSLAQLASCPGSFRLQQGKEEQTNKYADEGVALHLACEKGIILDEFNEEQKDCIYKCLDYLEMLAPKGSTWEKEGKVSLLDGFDILTEGTADVVSDLDDLVLGVDYKFGRNPVKVENNLQVQAYSAALMQKYGKPVEFSIAQPRLNYFQSVRFELAELPVIIEKIKTIIENCNKTVMVLNPTEANCRYCLAKNTCPAVNGIITDGALANIEHCSELSTEVIADLLPKAKAVKKVIASLENQARERLIAGEEIPGWGIKVFHGKQKVVKPQNVYEAISDWVKHEDFMECVDIKITKLLDTYARSRQEKEKEAGHKISLKQLKEELNEAISPFTERDSDSKRLTQISED